MKFIFKNLGPIHEAELELGDLTIIAGRNNTGKTYVAYALYGFLISWFRDSFHELPDFFYDLSQELLSSNKLAQIPDVEELTEKGVEEDLVKLPVDRAALDLIRKSVMQAASRDFSVNSLCKDFEGASLEVVLDEMFPEDVPNQTVSISNGETFTIAYSGNEIRIGRIKGSGGPPSTDDLDSDDLLFDRSELLFLFILPEISEPFILSAERFGISIFYRELVSNFRETFDRNTSPVIDNIVYTNDIPRLRNRRSEIYDSRLFNDIRDMMGGSYAASGDDIRFKSKARKDGFDIPLHIVSSSARGLSNLYFFLRHVARKGQLLIIDEPESHLDTANQIKFARLLARAVRAGLKVLITTHSDYIVKEINNLLMLSEPFEEKEEVLKELGYSKHDFLKPDSVRAYVAEKNSLTRCTIDRYGINMPVFDEAIDSINRVSNQLSVRLKYEGEG